MKIIQALDRVSAESKIERTILVLTAFIVRRYELIFVQSFGRLPYAFPKPPYIKAMAPITFHNTYAALPEQFYRRMNPAKVARPYLVRFNHALAEELGIGGMGDEEITGIFSGNVVPGGAEPLAMAYAGHQFGNFVPTLGDGRALLLGQIIARDGLSRDLHFKGSGPTPFARRGDGRSPLGPVIREYIVSEAMHRLGIPTTRSLAVIGTGETVRRETPLPGGILTRVARSHVRIGTFQYFAARRDHDSVRVLADYVIGLLYPQLKDADNPYRALLETVIAAQARLVAQWMGAGFIHGVINTDNMSISGETIDYGPCAFMDEYNPDTVFSSIDVQGRYAYGNQPYVAQWNLTRLAECLVPLLHPDTERGVQSAQEAIETFPDLYTRATLDIFARKIGLTHESDDDENLVAGLLEIMAAQKADFTLSFRAVALAADQGDERELKTMLGQDARLEDWVKRWRARRVATGADKHRSVRDVNPLYIPRNHLVEEAIGAAMNGDFLPLNALLEVLDDPFHEQKGRERYALPPHEDERVCRTFCGT